MRPHRLIMSAFGPYAGEEVIDFKDINDKNIFVITGPTGAGKTTIFDGISYALYGRASGAERDGDNLRSDFAKDDTATYVELEFELKGKKYVIRRTPKQLMKKRRGEGFTEASADAALVLENGKIIKSVNNVNEEIANILGITYEQFKQIVMIPQGEFRELLLADSEKREVIFRKIFGTYEFERIQDLLDKKAKSLSSEIGKLEEQRKANIKNIDPGEDEILLRLINSDSLNVSEIMDKTEFNIKNDEKSEDVLEIKKSQIEQNIEKLQRELQKGNEINKKFNDKKNAEDEIGELEKRRTEYKEKSLSVLRGRKALSVKGSDEYYINRCSYFNKLKEELTKAQDNVKISKIALEDSKKALTREENKEDERKALSDKLANMNADLVRVRDYEAKQKEFIIINDELSKKDKEKEEKKLYIESLKNEKERVEEDINLSKKAAVEFVEVQAKLDKKIEVESKLLKLKAEYTGLNEIRNLYSIEKKSFNESEAEYKALKEKYESLNEIFLKGQAGLLAGALKKDEPCPVCGSKIHPKPAALIEGIPSEEELKALKSEFDALEIRYNNLLRTLTEYKTSGDSQGKTVNDLLKDLGKYIDTDNLSNKDLDYFIKNNMECISKEIKDLSITKEELDKKRKSELLLTKRYKEITEGISLEEKNILKIDDEYRNIFAKVQSEKSILKRLEEELPENIRTEDMMKSEIEKIQSEYKALTEAFKKAQENHREMELKYNSSLENLKSIEKNNKDVNDEINKAYKLMAESINKAGFIDYDDYKKSMLSEEEIEKAEKAINDYKQRCIVLNERMNSILKELENCSIIDIEDIKSRIGNENTTKAEFENEIKRIFSRIDKNKGLLSNINKINDIMRGREEKYKVIGHLANIARGQNAEKISFERYVLAAYFDEIIEAANIRLSKMTSERYELSRIEEKMKGRAQQGLDLEVYDNYTGKLRHVKTLSGGESFKASLSLALGLADVVQSHAGGINLDTMFIDEGFGTLDPESLENAIQCLLELQKSGRLVGIISHVPELRDRINCRLEIIPSMQGSTHKLVVL